MNEFRRLINRKIIFIFAAFIMLNVAFYVYQQARGTGLRDLNFSSRQMQWLADIYKDYQTDEAMEAVRSDIQTIKMYRQADSLAQDTELLYDGTSEVLKRYCGLSEHNQKLFLDTLKELEIQLEYISEYPEDIKMIQENAQQLMSFSIFSDKNSFTYNNIIKTAKDFSKVSEVSLYIADNNKAVEGLVNYYFPFYLSLIMMVFIIYGLSGERDNGMWEVVHSAGNGRLRLALHRLMVITGSGVIVTAGLYFSTFAASLFLYGGADSLSAPVQNIQAFKRFAMPMSQIGYVMYDYAYSTLAVIVLSMVLWAVFVLNRKRNHALIMTVLFAGLEVFMYFRIDIHSVYTAFKQFNIVRLMRVNEIISTYANRGKGSFVISESAIMFCVLIVIFCIAAVAAVAGTVVMRPQQQRSVFTKILDKIYEGYQHIFSKMPVVVKELHKLLVTSRGITVILVLLAIVIYFVGYGRMTFSDSMKQCDRIYLESGGADYSQIEELVNGRKNDYVNAVEKAAEAATKYEGGELEPEELSKINAEVYVYASRYSSVREFEEKYQYLTELEADTGIHGYMMSDRGYEEIFGRYSKVREMVLLIALLVAVVMIVSENIGIENRTGTKYIVNAAGGRNEVRVKRIVASLLLSIVLFAIVYGIDMFFLSSYYGMPYIQAPLMSLMFMQGCGLDITIGTFIIIRLIVRLAIMLMVYAVTYVLCSLLQGIRARAVSMLIIIAVIVFVVVMGNISMW